MIPILWYTLNLTRRTPISHSLRFSIIKCLFLINRYVVIPMLVCVLCRRARSPSLTLVPALMGLASISPTYLRPLFHSYPTPSFITDSPSRECKFPIQTRPPPILTTVDSCQYFQVDCPQSPKRSTYPPSVVSFTYVGSLCKCISHQYREP